MKVHSINGPIPDKARPPANAPGLRTQADITARMRPRTDVTETTLTDLPILKSGKALCGDEANKDTLTEFIKNSVRSRSLVQEWYLTIGDESVNSQWQPVCSARELQKLSVHNLATMLADALALEENAVAARISIKDGMTIAVADSKATGTPSLTIWYRQIT